MPNPLLDRSSPAELAELGQAVEKQVQIQSFAGLTEVLAADLASLPPDESPAEWRHEPVMIRLRFGWANHGARIPAVEGRVTATVPAVCQRCLGMMQLALDEEFNLLLAGPGDTAAAMVATADDYELWEIDEASIRPLDMVEEVLIMAMPLAALHEPGEDCEATLPGAEVDVETTRPFAALRETLAERKVDNENETTD